MAFTYLMGQTRLTSSKLRFRTRDQRLKPEQIVALLRQIDALKTHGKTLAQACKEVGTVEQSYYRWPLNEFHVDGSCPKLLRNTNITFVIFYLL